MSLDASDSAVPQIAGTAAPRISWVPPAGGFAGLSMLNGLLRILTLGVYHFWGKTEVRQRIWSAVRIDGSCCRASASTVRAAIVCRAHAGAASAGA